jgi:hypothetical protein
MKFGKAMLASLLLAATPLATQAEGMSYSYVEADYVDVDIDNAPSGDGFGLHGSVGFSDNWFVFADYLDGSVDIVDIENISVGVGGHYPLGDNLDAVGRVGYTEFDVSASGFGSVSDDGYLLSLGLRGQVSQFEAEGNVIYTDLSDGGDETAFEVAGRWNFTEMFSAALGYRMGDDVNVLFAGVRLSW